MKKNPMPKMKDTRANRKGMKASIFRKKGSMRNAKAATISTIPTAKLYVRLSIFP